ncbi:unnamed protein product [Peniophora sp. CBMAI 1063]|nr:unnamed protein product [Peniophora sp. CBMAI 1063]
MTQNPTLTLQEKLAVVPAMLAVLMATLYAAIQWHFIDDFERAASFDRHIRNAIHRQLTTSLNVRQLQFILGTTKATFEKWVKANPEAYCETDVAHEGTYIHWLGGPYAGKIIFHIHGGDNILPPSAGHLAYLLNLREAICEAGGDTIAVAVVEYASVPHKSYQTRLREANAALEELLSYEGIEPSKIILSGDSAGAHILLGLLSQLLQSHPDLPAPPLLRNTFGGLLLISPRVSSSTSAGSFAQNSHRDVITRETVTRWFSACQDSNSLAQDGYYMDPADAPASWWNGLSAVVSEVFISAGEHECMRDDILRFAESWETLPGIQIRLVIEEKEAWMLDRHESSWVWEWILLNPLELTFSVEAAPGAADRERGGGRRRAERKKRKEKRGRGVRGFL